MLTERRTIECRPTADAEPIELPLHLVNLVLGIAHGTKNTPSTSSKPPAFLTDEEFDHLWHWRRDDRHAVDVAYQLGITRGTQAATTPPDLRIPLIKYVRSSLDITLKESKDIVDALYDYGRNSQTSFWKGL